MKNRLTHCVKCRRMSWHAETFCILCEEPGPLKIPTTPPDDLNHLDVLRRYQAYRRGHDERLLDDTGLCPTSIGNAIDAGIEALEQLRNTGAPHLNPASQTPPVDVPLIIQVGDRLIPCIRKEWAGCRSDSLVFYMTEGGSIHGRYPWTYP